VSELSHLWQRFLLTSSLVVGLAIGAAATVFGYSNLGSVNVRWSVFHIDGVPLWTVAVVPLAVVLVAGTLYHWMDGLHHFTEHMRHRRRVHELEAEVASLRAHLDHVLEMPDRMDLPDTRKVTSLPAADEAMAGVEPEETKAVAEPTNAEAEVATPPSVEESAATPDPAAANGVGDAKPGRRNRGSKARRASLTTESEASNGDSAADQPKSPAPKEADAPVIGA
jgi:hypothetical protein